MYDGFTQKKGREVFVKIVTEGGRVPERGHGVVMHFSDMLASVPGSY